MESGTIFINHIKSHKLQYLLGAALLSISCLVQLRIPSLLEGFTDGLRQNSLQLQEILELAIWIGVIGFTVALFRSTSRIYLFRLSRILEKRIRTRLFTHWEKLSAEYYNKQRIGDLMSHAINDVNVIRDVSMNGVYISIEAFVMITITVIAMAATVDVGLTLLVMIPLPALSIMAYKFRKQINTRATRVQEAIGQLTARVQQFCSGIRVIKTYVQEQEELDKFTKDNHSNVEANWQLIKSNSLFTSASQAIVGFSYLISVVFGGILVMKGSISLGEFVAFNAYLAFLVGPVENIGKVINVMQKGKAADTRLRHILSTQPEVQDDPVTFSDKIIEGDIRISDLTFTYPGNHNPALQNINIHVPKGSSLAIVGKVGSGKSTLITLLLRLYNPPRGTMFIDGHDIFKWPLQVLRRSIGYVPQEYFLFSTTIGDNIAFDPRMYYADQVGEAAKLAQVHDNIIEFPHKFETTLGERGISLSGGQRQRISIARALIKNPAILIFDDSLSAVDAETEERILEGLKVQMKGKTSILVSHRISSIMAADQIIVMDKGKIIEQGNHESLLKFGGMYANMHYKQLLNREMGESKA